MHFKLFNSIDKKHTKNKQVGLHTNKDVLYYKRNSG